MRDVKTVLAVDTYAGINTYRQEHERLIQIGKKKITDDSIECTCHNRIMHPYFKLGYLAREDAIKPPKMIKQFGQLIHGME